MKNMKKLHICLMTVLLGLAFVMTSLAADSTLTYKGREDGFEYGPGSVYVHTDLFDNFKDVMPGDVKAETITITNDLNYKGYINVYMGALLHDKENNPISPKVLEELAAVDRKGTMDELAYMHEFLDQMTLKVWNGEMTDANLVYSGTPNSLEHGFEDGTVALGKLTYGQNMVLNVELSVNKDMGNEYAGRIAEVDWVFVVEERSNSSGGSGSGSSQKPGIPVVGEGPGPTLDAPGDPEFNLNVLPMTGDETVVWPYWILLILALVGMGISTVGKRKKDKK